MNRPVLEGFTEAAEAQCTFSGRPIPPLQRGLPKTVESVCPECARLLPAKLFEKDGQVRMEKTCPEHGFFEDVYWSDARIYLKAEAFHYGDGEGLENPNAPATSRCPEQCGLCQDHASNTALGNIDLTNRCNLKCPICFASADAAGYVYEPTYEQVLGMMKTYRAMRPSPARAIQFSGGEPTLHPRFLDILRAAKGLGFSHRQIASNGLRFAQEEDFAKRCEEAGLHDVYLQFDGVSDDVWERTRGRQLMAEKMKAVERIMATDMKIVLVPTIVRGINDGQVGRIVQFALDRIQTIAGISFQPVAFTGRIDTAARLRQRYTLTDLAQDVLGPDGDHRRTARLVPPVVRAAVHAPGGRRPGPAEHRHVVPPALCARHVPLRRRRWRAVPLPRFFDLKGLLDDMWKLAQRAEKSRFKVFQKIQTFAALRRNWRQEGAPAGMDFNGWLHSINGMIDKNVGRGEAGKKTFRSLLVAGMHFMDRYNYETDRARRCVIHYADPDGKLYPFCTYNAGPVHCRTVERKFAMTPEEYRRRQGE